MVDAPRPHSNDNPLWQGPCGEGWFGGITQSMLARFLSCRERFRLKYILGLEPHDKWNHRLGYGHMWHVCEEAFASGKSVSNPRPDEEDVADVLATYASEMLGKYPLQQDEIAKWYNVCKVQFPEYVKYWSEHPDVKNREPLLQEQVFDVPYTLPSGRVVRLRGRWDSVDLVDGGIWLQENKTKGDIDRVRIERQLKFDLQTMLYMVALQEPSDSPNWSGMWKSSEKSFVERKPIRGVRYNVVRRPLSGGRGNITPHKAKSTKNTYTPAETEEQFYERLRHDYIAAEPDYWFFRIRAEITPRDLRIFCKTCLNPLLETVCWWYDEVTDRDGITQVVHPHSQPLMNYRTPFGVYSALEEGGATEYDAYMDTGSEAGLRRTEEMFTELR